MKTQRSRDYDHLEFLLSNPGSVRAAQIVGGMARTPTEASGTQEVPLPVNPIRRGRKRFEWLSAKHAPARSRSKMETHAERMRLKLAEADSTGLVYVIPGGQYGIAADSKWYAYIRNLLNEIRERLEALNDRFSYELSAIDPVKPLRERAEDETQHERQRPPAEIRSSVEQLTATIVIAPGAPGRN
jgi:hypothetical protein